MDLRSVRYADDDPALYGFESKSRGMSHHILSRALSQNVRVSPRVLPAVHDAVGRARERLGVARPVHAFVYPSPDTNAYCCSDSEGAPVLVFVSSSLVRLLTGRELQFVIGHEFGHFLFGHFDYPTVEEYPADLRLLELRRASELSADRAGLVACHDVEIALQATLKVASGLDASALDIDIREYVAQVRELHEGAGDESLLYASHPSFPLRARALLRFDSFLARVGELNDVSIEKNRVDEETRRDMDRAANGATGNRFTDVAVGMAFWDAACRVCADGGLTIQDQTDLARRFGSDKVDALKRALSSRGRSEARDFLLEKKREAEERLSGAPLFVVRAARDALHGFR